MRRFALAAAAVVLGAGPAPGCPLCRSETGRRVRAGLFGADFGYNLVATALPFLVLLSIVALIALAPVPASGRRSPTPPGGGGRRGTGPATPEGDSWATD